MNLSRTRRSCARARPLRFVQLQALMRFKRCLLYLQCDREPMTVCNREPKSKKKHFAFFR
jgi:hypothetical protein